MLETKIYHENVLNLSPVSEYIFLYIILNAK